MPKQGLGYLQTGNVSAKRDARRLQCKPYRHHRTCRNVNAESDPGVVRYELGCAAIFYWRARCRIGTESGPRQLDAIGKTRGEAESHLLSKVQRFVATHGSTDRVQADAARQGPTRTFASVFDEWLRSKNRISPETRHRYQLVFDAALPSAVKESPVSLLTPPMLHDVLTRIPEQRDDGKWTRVSYVKHAHYLLTSTLSMAVRTGLVAANVMREVEVPEPPLDAVRQQARPVSERQFVDIRSLVAGDSRYAPWLIPLLDLLGGTGLRIGEALAIRRDNLLWTSDPRVRVLRIDSHLVPDYEASPSGTIFKVKPGLKETKHRQSDGRAIRTERLIELPDGAIAALNEQASRVPAVPDALLFLTSNGTLIAPRNVRRSLQSAAKRASVPAGISPHSFRRMVASEIDRIVGDSGVTAAGYIGNTPDVANAHYIQLRPRTSPRDSGAIADELMRRIAPERYQSGS